MVTVEYVKYVILVKSPKAAAARSLLAYINSAALSRAAHDTFRYSIIGNFPVLAVKFDVEFQSNCEKAFRSTDTLRESVRRKDQIYRGGKTVHNGEQCFRYGKQQRGKHVIM